MLILAKPGHGKDPNNSVITPNLFSIFSDCLWQPRARRNTAKDHGN